MNQSTHATSPLRGIQGGVRQHFRCLQSTINKRCISSIVNQRPRKPKCTNRLRLYAFELPADPRGKRRRRLRVQPEDRHQTARTGWSSLLLACRRAASMSAGSRSGSSSSTCTRVSPAARRSSTSITRTRIPRIHGRPPHCAGLKVIRSGWPAIWVTTSCTRINDQRVRSGIRVVQRPSV